mgnify:CR=1 FL=1
MKTINFCLVILFLSLFTSPLFSQTVESQKSLIQKDSVIKTASLRYEVFGMDCPGCESAIEKQLNKIVGIEKVSASWENQEVKIWISKDANVNEETILKHIKKANFTPGKKILNASSNNEK